MVLTELLLKIPYSFTWRLVNASQNPFPVCFYCADFLDFLVFAPIKKSLPEITIISKNRKIQNQLFTAGVSSILWPAYPKVIIMARHSLHMFPSKRILKIGMRHGPYNFKKFIDAKKYNQFNLFLFTSENEVESAKNLGIKNGVAVGFPKIDELHNGSINSAELDELKTENKIDNTKSTIMFSATWNKSEISAIIKWYDKLNLFTENYNVIVTVHPFTEKKIIEIIKKTPKVCFVQNENLNPYFLITDLLISDTSSIIAEFNTLNKPIITFEVEEKGRLNPEIVEILSKISFRIKTLEDLVNIIPIALENKNLHAEQRQFYNKIMFPNLDGNSGKISSDIIDNFIKKAEISY